MNKEMRKWFLRGFGLTALALILALSLVNINNGQAQEPDPSNQDSVPVVEPQTGPLTDDPDGMMGGEVSESPEMSNNQLPVIAGEMQAGSDDPLGRGPLVPVDLPEISNADTILQTFSQQTSLAGPNEPSGVDATANSFVIPAADFRSDGSVPDGFFFSFSGGYVRGSTTYPCLMAPAYLPSGANIKEFWTTAYDNDASSDLYLQLWRVDNYAGTAADLLAQINTTGAYTTLQNPGVTGINSTVMYPDYSYYVTTCINSTNIRFYSVRLYY